MTNGNGFTGKIIYPVVTRLNVTKSNPDGKIEVGYRTGARNVLKEGEAESLVKEFKDGSKSRIDYALLDDGVIDREILLAAMQGVYGVAPFDVRGYFFNHQLLLFFPKDFLINKAIIPVEVDDDMLTVVMGNPEDEEAIEALGDFVGYTINVLVGIERDIVDAVAEYYDEDVVTSENYEQTEDVNDDGQDEADIVDLD